MNLDKRAIKVPTRERFDIVAITEEIQSVVDDGEIDEGLVVVTTPHTTAAVSTNENERRLFLDMIEAFHEFVPPEAGYRHDRHHTATDTRPNAHAHIICAMLKTSVVLTTTEGTLNLGKWEDILLLDADGPNSRTVSVTLLS